MKQTRGRGSPARRAGLWLLALGAFIAGCSEDSTQMSFAGFQAFNFQQNGAFGFCPDQSAPARFEILRGSDNEGVLRVYRIEMAARSDSCLYLVSADSCLVFSLIRTDPIGAPLMSEVDALFSSVRVHDRPDPDYEGVVIDPCLTKVFRWDEFQVLDLPTAASRVDAKEADRLQDRLIELLGLEPDWTGFPTYGPP